MCAIVGGIYAVSSIFESFLRNTISIFSIGDFSEQRNRGAGPATSNPRAGNRKVVRRPENA